MMCRFWVTASAMGVVLCLAVRAPGADVKGSAAVQAEAVGEDWPAFLGPMGNGVTRDAGIADRWPEKGPPVLWTKRFEDGYAAL